MASPAARPAVGRTTPRCAATGPESTGLRHFRSGNVEEALWWWQFSYVSSWGNLASAALSALLSVVAHDRLDAEFEGEEEQVAAADQAEVLQRHVWTHVAQLPINQRAAIWLFYREQMSVGQIAQALGMTAYKT